MTDHPESGNAVKKGARPATNNQAREVMIIHAVIEINEKGTIENETMIVILDASMTATIGVKSTTIDNEKTQEEKMTENVGVVMNVPIMATAENVGSIK